MSARPWERQDYDTEQSWQVFVAYRDQHPPRRAMLYSINGVNLDQAQVARWKHDHFWAQRCVEYDRWLDEIRLEERANILKQDQASIVADHLSYTANMREVMIRESQKAVADSKASGSRIPKLREITGAAKDVLLHDRLVRDQPTQIESSTVDLTNVSDEALEIARKAVGLP